MRPCWELVVEADLLPPLVGVAHDIRIVSDVRAGRRSSVMRLWQPDRAVILVPDGSGPASERADVAVVERPTPGLPWLAEGPAAILWSTITTPETLGSGEKGELLEAGAEWVLASLRQLGMQASLEQDGTVLTPMGAVGACAVAQQNGIVLGQGIVNYAMDVALEGHVCSENVRSQSGLPLPLVLDRFARMARTLHRATVVPPSRESAV